MGDKSPKAKDKAKKQDTAGKNQKKATAAAKVSQQGNAGAAKKLKQYGFDLVVTVLGGHEKLTGPQHAGEQRVSRVACERFERLATLFRNRRAQRDEGHAPRLCLASALLGPIRTRGLKTMVDMRKT